VFSVDPNDFRHMYAADWQQKILASSVDAGQTWKQDLGLSSNITVGGASMEDSLGQSQVHAIAFDPSNSSHILVGTDQAGIFASANGGVTWSALPSTARATAITSFFFDDRTNAVLVGTYGRGLWKLTVDWAALLSAPSERNVAAASTVPIRDVKVIYGPLVQVVTDTLADISWSTSTSTDTLLLYGTSPDHLDRTARSRIGGTIHSVELKDLLPDTIYYYRVGRPASQSAEPMAGPATFRTAPKGRVVNE
jgi:hypothetical protein